MSHAVPIGEFMLEGGGSVNPAQFAAEPFDLFSIPAYESGVPETVLGAVIGSAKKRVEPGDVLLSRIVPHIKRCWVVPEAGPRRQIASGEWIVFRTNRMYGDFLRHYLLSDRFHHQFMRTVSGVGGSLLRARPAQVATITVPTPPLDEQKRIADILDKADAIRHKRQQAIALTEDLLRSAFLDMFGDPIANKQEWKKVPLASVAPNKGDLVDGPFGSSLKPDRYVPEGVRVIRNFNISPDEFDASAFKYVTPETFEQLRRSEVRGGDILISTKGTVGNVCRMPEMGEPALLSASGTVRMRITSAGWEPAFLVYQMTMPSFRQYIGRRLSGTIQKYLNLSGIRNLTVLKPPTALQAKFVAMRGHIRAMQADQRGSATMTGDLFGSLSQRAFRGDL